MEYFFIIFMIITLGIFVIIAVFAIIFAINKRKVFLYLKQTKQFSEIEKMGVDIYGERCTGYYKKDHNFYKEKTDDQLLNNLKMEVNRKGKTLLILIGIWLLFIQNGGIFLSVLILIHLIKTA